MSVLIALLLIVLTGGIGYMAWRLSRNSSSPLLAKRGPTPTVVASAPAIAPTPVDPDFIDPVITDPPLVHTTSGQIDTVGHHLKNFSWKGYSWDEVVFETYRRVLNDRELEPYFHGVKSLNDLQRHFVHAIKIVTMDGIKTQTYIYVADKHRGVRDRQGRPITGAAYDKTVDILVKVLAEKGVPQAGIDSLGPVVAQLRRAIVAEPETV